MLKWIIRLGLGYLVIKLAEEYKDRGSKAEPATPKRRKRAK